MSSRTEASYSTYGRITAGLITALLLSLLAAALYPLLRTPAQDYAAVPANATPARTTAYDTPYIFQAEHRAIEIRAHDIMITAWQRQVVLDAKIRAAKIAAAKAQLAAQQAQQGFSAAGFSSFKACVAMRESTDGQASHNIYGILGGLWPGVPSDPWYSIALPYSSAWVAPYSVQSRVFDLIYAQQGTAPWAPYDGC